MDEEIMSNHELWGLGVQAASTLIAAGALYFAIKTIRENTKWQHMKAIFDLHKEIDNIEAETDQTTEEWALRYANLHKSIIYFVDSDTISPDSAKYFHDSFSKAYGILQERDLIKKYPDMKPLQDWCEKNQVPPNPPRKGV